MCTACPHACPFLLLQSTRVQIFKKGFWNYGILFKNYILIKNSLLTFILYFDTMYVFVHYFSKLIFFWKKFFIDMLIYNFLITWRHLWDTLSSISRSNFWVLFSFKFLLPPLHIRLFQNVANWGIPLQFFDDLIISQSHPESIL